MTYYAGPKQGDESPQGGGKHNAKNLGHEVFNFHDFDGTLYGTFGIVRPNVSRPHIELRRVDPATSSDAESLEGVLVIFVAPYEDGQRIVGWYRDAKVHRTSVRYPSNVKRGIQEYLARKGITNPSFNEYWIEAKSSNAVLVPQEIRIGAPIIPRGLGAMGQSNVCYPNDVSGTPKGAPWIKDAFDFVSNYRHQNLLTEPTAEADDEILKALERAGFQSNAEIRGLVEERAMTEAKRELLDLGFNDFVRTAESECYDYTCRRSGTLYYVEVKGTQELGKSVILTRNEVEHAKKYPDSSIFVLVHSIRVRPNGTSFDVSEGTVRVCIPWLLDSEELKPICFSWVYNCESHLI
jgi:hypothetical protein